MDLIYIIPHCLLSFVGSECKKRWKSMRDHYKRDKKEEKGTTGKAAKKKRAQYWQRLQFLDTVEDERASFTNVLPQQTNVEPRNKPYELQNACSFKSQPAVNSSTGNQVNATALYWSQKLEKLNPTQRVYAEKYINDILFEAEIGNLGRNSVYINCPNQYEAPSPTSSRQCPSPAPPLEVKIEMEKYID